MTNSPSRSVAHVESVFVALTWASSFVFVKIALKYMGPLTLAGLRYFLAFLLLLPLVMRKRAENENITHLANVNSFLHWARLAAIGVSAYTVGNAALFWGLKYLPATTGSFLLSLIPLFILLAGVIWLRETPTRPQLLGVGIALAGSVLFFGPGLQAGNTQGMAIVGVGLVGFTAFGILGRAVAKGGGVDTLTLTAIPLGIGGGLLLIIAFFVEGWLIIPIEGWGVVLFLATINTALAYTLYNHALSVLTAIEMNVILNLSPLGTAVFAWLLLGETLVPIQFVGMGVVIVGVALVQRGGRE